MPSDALREASVPDYRAAVEVLGPWERLRCSWCGLLLGASWVYRDGKRLCVYCSRHEEAYRATE